eukprot:jgi/Ulvmu1/348/UM001_0353.1
MMGPWPPACLHYAEHMPGSPIHPKRKMFLCYLCVIVRVSVLLVDWDTQWNMHAMVTRAGYSAMLVVDGEVDSSSIPTFECGTDLLGIGSSGPVHVTDSGKDYIVFQEELQASLKFSESQMLHVDSHGGFAVLMSVQIETSAADQTVFSFVDDQGAYMQLLVDIASNSYTFTVAESSGPAYSVQSPDGSAPAGVQQTIAVQFERHTYNMDIMAIDSSLVVTSIATQTSQDAVASAMASAGITMPDLQIVNSAIGADVVSGSALQFFNGRIKTLALFDQTLTSDALSDAAGLICSDNGCNIPHGPTSYISAYYLKLTASSSRIYASAPSPPPPTAHPPPAPSSPLPPRLPPPPLHTSLLPPPSFSPPPPPLYLPPPFVSQPPPVVAGPAPAPPPLAPLSPPLWPPPPPPPTRNLSNLEPDTQAPLLFLLGDATMTVRLGTPFRDPGAVALDARSPDAATVMTLGLSELQQALEAGVADPALLGATGGTGLHGPWVLEYIATDAAGNMSPFVPRRVYIDSGCPAGTAWCAEARACVSGACLPAALARTLGIGTAPTQAEEFVPPVDTSPPTLVLTEPSGGGIAVSGLGLPAGFEAAVSSTVILGDSEFEDPGWEAVDTVDGNLTAQVSRRGLAEVHAAVTAGIPTLEGSPLYIRYRVADSSGNEAQALRAVHISCPDDERTCESEEGRQYCSVERICLPLADETAQTSGQTAPELVLVGDAVVYVAQGTPYFKCARKQPLHVLCDQGVQATHPVEGDVSAYVDACAPNRRFSDVGLEACELDTATVGRTVLQFSLTYTATNTTVQVVRMVVVYPVCVSGEVLCSTLVCAASGVCLPGLPLYITPANNAPRLTLADEDAVVKYVARGVPYNTCKTDESSESSCAAAPAAFDEEDGSLTDSVLACPPDECLLFGCPGHEFRKKGLQGCGVDTVNGTVGSKFELTFVVFDRDQPPANASLQQSIIVTSPCASSQTYCPDKAPLCGSGPCDLRPEPAPPAVPPDMLVDVSAAGPFTVVLSNESSSEDAAPTLHVAGICGQALPVDLAVCGATPGAGLPERTQQGWPGCLLAVQQDAQVDAQSTIVTATNDPQCAYGAQEEQPCFLCSIRAASDGQCIASHQVYELLAVDERGLAGAPLQLSISIAHRCALVDADLSGEIAAVSNEALQEIVEAGPDSLPLSAFAGAMHDMLLQHVAAAPACSVVALQDTVVHVELQPGLSLVGSPMQTDNGVLANVSMKATIALGIQNSTQFDSDECEACTASMSVLHHSPPGPPIDVSGQDSSGAWLTSLLVDNTTAKPHECPVTVTEAAELTLMTEVWNVETTLSHMFRQLDTPWIGDLDESAGTAADICIWVKDATDMQDELFILATATASRLGTNPSDWPFLLWIGGCSGQLALAKESPSTNDAEEVEAKRAFDLLQAIAGDNKSTLQLTGQLQVARAGLCIPAGSCSSRRLSRDRPVRETRQLQESPVADALADASSFQNTVVAVALLGNREQPASGELQRPGRDLLAKAASKSSSGSGGVQAAMRTVDVSTQEWTTADVSLNTSEVSGTLQRTRMLGVGNVILGGIVIEQERSQQAQVLFCNGRFSQLVARCTDPFAAVLEVSPSSAFGTDPAFNPSSTLYDASAAAYPGEYYNVSQGSNDMSALGNPYGFFPGEQDSKTAPFNLVLPT